MGFVFAGEVATCDACLDFVERFWRNRIGGVVAEHLAGGDFRFLCLVLDGRVFAKRRDRVELVLFGAPGGKLLAIDAAGIESDESGTVHKSHLCPMSKNDSLVPIHLFKPGLVIPVTDGKEHFGTHVFEASLARFKSGVHKQGMRRIAPERPRLDEIADVNPVVERKRLEAFLLLFGPLALGRFHHADEMFLVVPTDGQDAQFLDDAYGTQRVGTFVDDVAGLVQRIASTDETELVDDCCKLVCATMNITDVESSFHFLVGGRK